MQKRNSKENEKEEEERDKIDLSVMVAPSTGLLQYGQKVEVNEANENMYNIWTRQKQFEIQNENNPGVKEVRKRIKNNKIDIKCNISSKNMGKIWKEILSIYIIRTRFQKEFKIII